MNEFTKLDRISNPPTSCSADKFCFDISTSEGLSENDFQINGIPLGVVMRLALLVTGTFFDPELLLSVQLF